VPSDDRFWFDDDECFRPFRPNLFEHYPKDSIGGRESGTPV
jgi:hypothetical protein